jgi:hypothetical protein
MHQNVAVMRTTVDIPEELLRQAKAEAALRGMKLKDYMTEALRAALSGELQFVAERAPEYAGADEQRLGHNCIFPLIRGAAGPAMRDLTAERLHAILEEEEVERELRSRDPR